MLPDEKFRIVSFFFSVRGCRPGKSVHMTEAEVRGLCLKSREIFLQQPILLELEAPLKICGKNSLILFKPYIRKNCRNDTSMKKGSKV